MDFDQGYWFFLFLLDWEVDWGNLEMELGRLYLFGCGDKVLLVV